MKTTINESGTLVIQAENSLESYALKTWIATNFKQDNIDCAHAAYSCDGKFQPTENHNINITINARYKNIIV